ncbi:hypothetical protein VARIO8X_90048 [Burkholderiales bacterium 8X]|nr:hypothetical protein VARIO8X_90048 [Burkholderiales bacterium 8X]
MTFGQLGAYSAANLLLSLFLGAVLGLIPGLAILTIGALLIYVGSLVSRGYANDR